LLSIKVHGGVLEIVGYKILGFEVGHDSPANHHRRKEKMQVLLESKAYEMTFN
jgi:hypothetical protein